jgi:hypothetical protein
MATPAVRTLADVVSAVADVDVDIVKTRWIWLHSVWAGDVNRTAAACTLLDELLELRFKLAAVSVQPDDWPA